jgi:hypothetical protein
MSIVAVVVIIRVVDVAGADRCREVVLIASPDAGLVVADAPRLFQSVISSRR